MPQVGYRDIPARPVDGSPKGSCRGSDVLDRRPSDRSRRPADLPRGLAGRRHGRAGGSSCSSASDDESARRPDIRRGQFGYSAGAPVTLHLARCRSTARLARRSTSRTRGRATAGPSTSSRLTDRSPRAGAGAEPAMARRRRRAGANRALFTARVSRLRGDLHVHRRSFARVIGQYVSTTRDPSLYLFAVDAARARSPARCSSPTSSTGSRCCMSATGTTASCTANNRLAPVGPGVLHEDLGYAFQR